MAAEWLRLARWRRRGGGRPDVGLSRKGGSALRIYKHTQVGTLNLLVFGVGMVGCAVLWILMPAAHVPASLALVTLVLAGGLFGALSVEVTADEVVLWFGPGLIRKRFRVADIRSARIVRNPWYYGGGIRCTPEGWMFNVSGFDAVELELQTNRKFRMGTDEPQPLLAAIQRVLPSTRQRS
jgi:hypothetical protein